MSHDKNENITHTKVYTNFLDHKMNVKTLQYFKEEKLKKKFEKINIILNEKICNAMERKK